MLLLGVVLSDAIDVMALQPTLLWLQRRVRTHASRRGESFAVFSADLVLGHSGGHAELRPRLQWHRKLLVRRDVQQDTTDLLALQPCMLRLQWCDVLCAGKHRRPRSSFVVCERTCSAKDQRAALC